MSGHIADMVSQEWNTPDYILDAVREVFDMIWLDPCDNEHSHTRACISYKLPEKDGLEEPWHLFGPVFCNPPYGRSILSPDRRIITPDEYRELTSEQKKLCKRTSLADWVKKASEVNEEHGTEIILLIPSATETTFWFDHIWHSATAVCFLRGRVAHPLAGEERTTASTKGSAVIYYGGNASLFIEAFSKLGKAIPLT